MNDAIRETAERIQWHIDEIEKLFKPGAKITVLVRAPSHPDGSRDFVMTNDIINEAISALLKRKHEEQRAEAGISRGPPA